MKVFLSGLILLSLLSGCTPTIVKNSFPTQSNCNALANYLEPRMKQKFERESGLFQDGIRVSRVHYGSYISLEMTRYSFDIHDLHNDSPYLKAILVPALSGCDVRIEEQPSSIGNFNDHSSEIKEWIKEMHS